MFRAIGKLKSDKRGFTLVELLTTMAILLIALTLTVEMMGIIWQNYRLIEYRWIIQTSVEYVAGCFQRDANREALATADLCDLYYEDMGTPNASGDTTINLACAPELGTLTYNKEDHSLTVDGSALSDANKEKITENSIYFISYDEHFYVIRYDDLYTVSDNGSGTLVPTYISTTKYPIAKDLNLVEEKTADVKVEVEFAVSGNALEYNAETHKEAKPGESVNGNVQTYTKYLPAGVTATIKGTIQDTNQTYVVNKTEFYSTIDLQNVDVNKGKSVNKTGSLLSSPYVAGWDKGNIKNYPGKNGMPDSSPDGLPSNPTHTANVVKYHSVNTPVGLSDSIQDKAFKINVNMPLCLFFSATIGEGNQEDTLRPIRAFRDNVLRKSDFGNFIIDLYYSVSPVAIKAMHDIPVFRGVAQGFTDGLSKILAAIT